MNKIGIFSTFLPTQCGIATYSEDLIGSLNYKYPKLNIHKFELSYSQKKHTPEKFVIRIDVKSDYIDCCDFINNSDIDLIDIQHEFKIFGAPDGENIEILLERITKPIVTTLHTVNSVQVSQRENLFKKILNRSDLLFVFSEYLKHLITNRYNIHNSKIIVIPHGTPDIEFRLPSEIALRRKMNKDLIFISTGHLRESKGYDVSIKALYNLKNILGDFHYYIVGANHPQNQSANNYRDFLSNLIKEHNLQNHASFIDKYLSLTKLIELIQMADICLLPYSRKEQSSSGVLALMIACGRPVVSTPFQFASSYLMEGSGVISRSFSHSDFSVGIKELIQKKDKWNEMMNFNYSLGQLWSWKKCISDLYYLNYLRVI